jgi:hypothetical protein
MLLNLTLSPETSPSPETIFLGRLRDLYRVANPGRRQTEALRAASFELTVNIPYGPPTKTAAREIERMRCRFRAAVIRREIAHPPRHCLGHALPVANWENEAFPTIAETAQKFF